MREGRKSRRGFSQNQKGNSESLKGKRDADKRVEKLKMEVGIDRAESEG